jgi:hypothetical protein
MELRRPVDFSRFESLGDNCEFGFVQRQLGSEEGSLFRWARIDAWQLYSVLANDFAQLYQFENLAAYSRDMVWERNYDFGWHTKMYSHSDGGKRVFQGDDAARRGIHSVEYRKHTYLVRKFLARLRGGGCIYLIKSNSGIASVTLDFLERELVRLAKGANFWLLELRLASDEDVIGHCQRVSDRHLVGYVKEFADYNTSDKFDLQPYRQILMQAVQLAPFDGWQRAQAHVEADLRHGQVVLPFPNKDFLGETDVTTDFGWCQASISRAHHWTRQMENSFRMHAGHRAQDRSKLSWDAIQRPGQWSVKTHAALAVDDSAPVFVQVAVRLNNETVSSEIIQLDSIVPVSLECRYHSMPDDNLSLHIEVFTSDLLAGGRRAVVDFGEIVLEAVT